MKKPIARVNRRQFLKKAGVGSIALASLPILGHALATPASAHGHGSRHFTNFHFDCQVNGPLAGNVQHFLAIAGCGSFNHAQVEGGGSFLHIDFNSAVPKTIFGSGSWKARRLVDFQPFGDPYGVFQAGIAHLDIDLIQVVPSQLVVQATLRIVCNVGPAGPASITGLPESIVLQTSKLTFDQPVAGLTVFTIGVEERG